MHKHFGILILPDTHTVHDVHADAWTDEEIRQKLKVGSDEFIQRVLERTGDSIFLNAFLNETWEGLPPRCEGFDLYGERFYGPALIVAGDRTGISPVLDPHDISRVIHFFRLSPSNGDAAGRFEHTMAGGFSNG